MEFGYFTLSDNHYPDNPRTAGQFVLEIREQAILADALGYHSAWIGEHHFDRFGVNSRPDIVLASIIPETDSIRLDYACGRGYDRAEYEPFAADFMTSAEVFEEGLEVVHKAWTEPGAWSHHGKYYQIENMEITPKPVQEPLPIYVGSFSKTSVDMAARMGFNIIYAPFAAAMVFGSLAAAVSGCRDATLAQGSIPGRAMCSYFIYIADTPEEEDLSDRSILIGSPARIIDSLKTVEAAGIDEVILYFNVGRKPHAMVKEQMHRFAEEIAPAFA